MDYEKKYKEALEKACQLCAYPTTKPFISDLQDLFPELKEGEDERIRNFLIDFIKVCGWTEKKDQGWPLREECIAWLEKHKSSEAALEYLRKNHSSSDVSDFQAAMNIAVAKAYDKGYNDGLKNQGEQKSYGQRQECVDCQFNYAGECKGSCDMKQGEQKPAELIKEYDFHGMKFMPKFKKGDLIREKLSGRILTIKDFSYDNGLYTYDTGQFPITIQNQYELVEQKPADKIEPKFKVGDWVVRGKTIAQILDIQEQYYIGLDINGNDFTSSRFLSDDKIHLWTIQDAKDGDVLANNGNVILFKQISDSARPDYKFIQSYCFVLTHSSDFYLSGTYNLDDGFHPAIKEQRDKLEKAMTDAGYTFDFEKKELKKLEQNHAWSEEDEKILKDIITDVKFEGYNNDMQANSYKKINWLKHLKERYTWKPSDKQMKAIEHICDGNYNVDLDILDSIYRDFKKLMKK